MNNHRRFVSHPLAVRLVIVGALVTAPFTRGVVGAVPRFSSPKSDPSVPIFQVGDGTPASCTQDAIQMQLNAATAGGGRIFFNCGRDPVTIPIGATAGVPLTLPDDTTIDGSGRITLVATTASGPSVSIDANAAVVLKNLNIVGGGGLFDAVVNVGR
jgi:hypothetical protein